MLPENLKLCISSELAPTEAAAEKHNFHFMNFFHTAFYKLHILLMFIKYK